MTDEGFVYILQSLKNGMYYIGACGDVEVRLVDHNTGRTKATRNKGPWVIKFRQGYPTIKEAKQIEYRLKKLKRRDYIEKIINEGIIRLQNGL